MIAGLVAAFPSVKIQAQWTVEILEPRPPATSLAEGTREGVVFGSSSPVGNFAACLWRGPGRSFVSLQPAGAASSRAFAGDAQTQGGYAYINGVFRAGIWRGTAESWTELHPSNATSSEVYAIDGQTQGGYAWINNVQSAGIWRGSSQSWLSLAPAGAIASQVKGVGGEQQVGTVTFLSGENAALWTGTASSWRRLVPPGTISSAAYATDGRQQVGTALIGFGYSKASLWRGSAESWIDLSPAPLVAGEARALYNGLQVGTIRVNQASKASLWNGSASSYEDLSLVLPAEFTDSWATGVWTDGVTVWVSGYVTDRVARTTVALLWSKPICVYLTDESTIPSQTLVRCPREPFSISASTVGPGPYSYQWRKGGVPLLDGESPTIQGATNEVLRFASLQLTDTGVYDCVITSACGSVTRTPVTLRVRPPCSQADLVAPGESFDQGCGDGRITSDDVIAFLGAFMAQSPRADLAAIGGLSQPDGIFTADDLIAFLHAVFKGC